jgi:hypothetical protein
MHAPRLLGRCRCHDCRRGYARWLASLAHHRAAGGSLWLLSIEGQALVEALRIVTSEPVRLLAALDRERLGVAQRDQPLSVAITVSPIPALYPCLACLRRTAIVALPCDQPFTIAQLTARGIDVHALPSPDAYDEGIGYREDRRGLSLQIRGPNCREQRLTVRQQAIATLRRALPALGDDEVRVLGLVATRLAADQRQSGKLALRTDRRDWRSEALDGLTFIAAALVRAGRRA